VLIRRSILSSAVGVAVALATIHARPAARRSSGAPAAADPIRLAVNMTTVESIPVFLAAEGRPVTVSAGGIPQLVDGSADAATNSETQALLRSVAAPNLRIVMTVAECFYRLVGRRSAGIQRVSDLRGKKIGTPANTSSHYYLALMLGRAKLTEADVTVVPMAVNLMGVAMKKGEVDAVSGWEPGAQDAIDALGSDAVVFQDRSVYRELFNLNTTTDVLSDPMKRRALVDVVRGMLAASERVRTRPAEGWPLLSSKIKMPEPTISTVWRHFRFAGGLPADILNVLTEEERWVAGLQKRQPRDRQALQALVDASVLRDARR
jgi:ABC-type nitrate/sulfonate/bicarbonate transport system substrate-binding protein